jgi:beta-barrel assembly-enhancing protease
MLLLCSALLLPACARLPGSLQPGTWFRSPAETMQIRLLDVAYPLLTAAAEWCPFDQEPTYGFLLQDEASGERTESHSLHGRAVVAYVHPSLPAALAGLSVGDVILSVNTMNVTGESPDDVGRLIGRVTRAKIQPLQIEILHGRERRMFALSARPACNYSLQVLDTPLINGISDGRQIGVTRGAMQFFRWDDELAWIVAHEIAHNVLSHNQNEKLRVMLRAFLLVWGEAADFVDALPSKPSLETQADYVGAYLMARAGYDLKAVRWVWERLARIEALQTGQKPGLAQVHPPTKERLAAFELTLQEIDAKRKAAQPLETGIGDEH